MPTDQPQPDDTDFFYDLLMQFLQSSTEDLEEVERLCVQLEQQKDAATNNATFKRIIDDLFRYIHTIKGNAALLNLQGIKSLGHAMEALLDGLRTETIDCTPHLSSLLLQGVDELRMMCQRLGNRQPEILDELELRELIVSLESPVINDSTQEAEMLKLFDDLGLVAEELYSAPPSVLEAFSRLSERLLPVDNLYAQVEETATATPENPIDHIQTILKDHQWDEPLSDTLSNDVHAHLQILQVECELEDHHDGKNIVIEMIEAWELFTDNMSFDATLKNILTEKLDLLAPLYIQDKPPSLSTSSAHTHSFVQPPSTHNPTPSYSSPEKMMRVAEKTIDVFLEHVGELLVIGDSFTHILEQVRQIDQELARDFRHSLQSFEHLSSELQSSIMDIRRVAIKPLLHKLPRQIRDLGHELGKNIHTKIIGEELLIDKSIFELLDTPLTHIVRNAVDHGIESIEQRAHNNKESTGNITVSAEENDTSLLITISDDGGGINTDALLSKAESLGLSIPVECYSPDEDIQKAFRLPLIFAPGLSTSENVSEISGRGVGMDAVKRCIEDTGGTIRVQSALHQGSRFEITLPKGVTTHILPAYLIQLDGHPFVLPLDRVEETIRIQSSDLNHFAVTNPTLTRNGRTTPFLALQHHFSTTTHTLPKQLTIVTTRCNDRLISLGVDNVLGVQKVVVRKMKGLSIEHDFVSGAALLGSGEIALVINCDALGHLAHIPITTHS